MCGLAGMLVGGAVVLAWVYVPHNYKEVYEMIPGFILSFLTIIVVSLLTKPVSKEIEKEFDEVASMVKNS